MAAKCIFFFWQPSKHGQTIQDAPSLGPNSTKKLGCNHKPNSVSDLDLEKSAMYRYKDVIACALYMHNLEKTMRNSYQRVNPGGIL